MHPQRKQRLWIVCFIVIAASLAVGLMVFALRENLNLFYPPQDVIAGKAPIERKIRIGGMVVKDSYYRVEESLEHRFKVTDYISEVEVHYTGFLPDMFEEEQGAVASGVLQADGIFLADQVLAKHDENYMPPEVAEALEASKEKTSNANY